MTHYEEIWRFETARFAVVFDVCEDEWQDLSWDEDGSVCEDLENGNLVAFYARVRVLLDGREIGADHLGECIYKSAREFIDHRGNGYHAIKPEGSVCVGSYFSDMVSMAVAEARKTLADTPTLRKAG